MFDALCGTNDLTLVLIVDGRVDAQATPSSTGRDTSTNLGAMTPQSYVDA